MKKKSLEGFFDFQSDAVSISVKIPLRKLAIAFLVFLPVPELPVA